VRKKPSITCREEPSLPSLWFNQRECIHPLLVLGFDVCAQPAETALPEVKDLQMDLSSPHPESLTAAEPTRLGRLPGRERREGPVSGCELPWRGHRALGATLANQQDTHPLQQFHGSEFAFG